MKGFAMNSNSMILLCMTGILMASAFAILENTHASVIFSGLTIAFLSTVMLLILKGEES